MKMNAFWKGVFSDGEVYSSKRLITLIVSSVFILSCITIIALLIMTFTSVTRTQNININALNTMTCLIKDVIYYEFMIVVAGLGFITAPQFADALTSRSKKKDDDKIPEEGVVDKQLN